MTEEAKQPEPISMKSAMIRLRQFYEAESQRNAEDFNHMMHFGSDFFVDLEKEFDMINEDEPSGGSKFGTLINWSCHDRKFYKREGGVKTDLDPQPKKLLLDFYNLRVGPVNLAKAQFDYVHFNDWVDVLIWYQYLESQHWLLSFVQ